MILRAGVAWLVVILVGVAFIGFATGDHVRHVWDKHPRHVATEHAGAPHVTWKTTPGTTSAVASLTALPFAGPVAAPDAAATGLVPARRPFVPPRV